MECARRALLRPKVPAPNAGLKGPVWNIVFTFDAPGRMARCYELYRRSYTTLVTELELKKAPSPRGTMSSSTQLYVCVPLRKKRHDVENLLEALGAARKHDASGSIAASEIEAFGIDPGCMPVAMGLPGAPRGRQTRKYALMAGIQLHKPLRLIRNQSSRPFKGRHERLGLETAGTPKTAVQMRLI